MATIDLDDVRKRYGKTDVIHGVDLAVEDGELIVIVGPSGCGKSTLLRMVAGLEVVSDGEIRIDGRRVNEVEPKDRDIAMVFQTYALYPHMSVFDNMAYGLKIAKVPTGEIRSRVEEAARLLALSELLERKPKALSGGQRQRVAMGRAIVRQPSVFLFDEPLSNLDALLRVQMRLEIRQLQRRLKVTSLYVTHDQVEAMTLADRLIVMNGGVAEQIDRPMNVYAKPASRFVAGFIGSPGMNFLPARFEAGAGELSVGDGIRLPLDPGAMASDATISGELQLDLGVRPEHLDLVSAGEAQWSMRVMALETLGADSIIYAQMPGQGLDTVSALEQTIAVRAPGNVQLAEGDEVHVRVQSGGMHLFDRQSGKRL